MSDLGNLLQMIYDLLSGWFTAFTSHATALMEKLNLIEDDTDTIVSNTSDIAGDTNDIKDNTGAIVTPVQSIKTNTDSIKNDTTTIKNNVSTMSNQLGTISTNVGTASAFTEDVANNTLDIKDKIVTIASDTTQIRSNTGNVSDNVTEIKDLLKYYFITNILTEDAEGSIANFDTDLKDYLQNAVVTIPADAGGISEAKIGYIDMNQYIQLFEGTHSGLTTSFDSNNNIVINGTITSTYSNITQSISCVAGHVYYISLNIIENPNNISIKGGLLNVIGGVTDANTMGKKIKVIKSDTTISSGSGISGITANTDMTGVKLKMIVIDLTKAFNASIAEVLLNNQSYVISLFPNSYYPYNAGGTMVTVESVNGSYYPNASVSFGSSITDGGELDLVTGVLKVNTTPPSLVQLTPAPIRTLKGLNSIWADSGDISVTYRETLKHYLEKQEV